MKEKESERQEEKLHRVIMAFHQLAGRASLEDLRMMLSELIRGIVGGMTDRDWEEFKVIKPCGALGCTCHLDLQPHEVRLYELLRRDYEEDRWWDCGDDDWQTLTE